MLIRKEYNKIILHEVLMEQEHQLILSSIVTRCVSISALACLVVISVVTGRSALGMTIRIKKYKKIILNRVKKHAKIVFLAKNSIEVK